MLAKVRVKILFYTLIEVIIVFSMKPNKTPGPDNIPIKFFQHCWGVVQSEVMLLFDLFHDNNLDVQRLNYGIITLLPKVVGANKIQQFRAICVLQCIYKLIVLGLIPFKVLS